MNTEWGNNKAAKFLLELLEREGKVNAGKAVMSFLQDTARLYKRIKASETEEEASRNTLLITIIRENRKKHVSQLHNLSEREKSALENVTDSQGKIQLKIESEKNKKENKLKRKKYTYEYPKADVTVDIIVSGKEFGKRKLLLIKRKNEPFKGKWALPGGFINMGEDGKTSAQRELKEETNLKIALEDIEEVCAQSRVNRDPRGRTIALVFKAEIKGKLPTVTGNDDADEANWIDIENLGKMSAQRELAFDHEESIKKALFKSKGKDYGKEK